MKKFLKFYITSILLFANCLHAQSSSETVIPLVLLKESGNGISFDKLYIENNQAKVINDSSLITFILPVSEGKSADIIKSIDRTNIFIIRNTGSELNIKIKKTDGREITYPFVSYEDLKTFRIRVNVMNGNGLKQAYIIDHYDKIYKDDGPVLDIFGGAIALDKNDYAITLETNVITESPKIYGSVPFEKIDGSIVVEAELPNGKRGKFILDTGATGSLAVKKDFLPIDTEISELKAIAYSSDKTEESQGKMIGANGTVADENFLGAARIISLKLGNMTFENVKTNVLSKLPEFIERHGIVGIIGIEIMKKSDIIRIENIDENKGEVKFINRESKTSGSSSIHLPLTSAGDLLFIDGDMQNIPVNFLVDLGARKCIIGNDVVEKNHINYEFIRNTNTQGISETKTDAIEGKINNVTIGDKNFGKMDFIISSNLYVTKSFGLGDSGALLGMSFFETFKNLEIDFVTNELKLEDR